jgi:hypothetical protein
MRCPVENHWAICRRADQSALTEEEWKSLELRQRSDDRAALRFESGRAVLVGAVGLVVSLVAQIWWAAIASVIWLVVWGVAYIRSRRTYSS